VFASHAIALANRSHEPNQSKNCKFHEDLSKTGNDGRPFQPQVVHPVRRGARAGNLGEKRTTPGVLVVHDRNGSVFNWLQLLKKLPNLTVLGAINHPSLHLAPRDLSVSSLLRQRESCLSLFILDLYELYRSTSQRQIHV
jgi:hypothetical protein